MKDLKYEIFLIENVPRFSDLKDFYKCVQR